MLQSYLVGREQCPRCRREHRDNHQDNLGVFNDGHKWCFACGFFLAKPTTVEDVRRLEGNERPVISNNYSGNSCDLPSDTSSLISKEGLAWLLKYGITPQEINTNFLWSASEQQLIFPVWDEEGKLLMWQARNFSAGRTKYYTRGNVQDTITILGDDGPLFLVEDVVSAIKLSRCARAIPLFGSYVSKDLIRRLKGLGEKHLTIWLDYDKANASIAAARRSRSLGVESDTVITPLDPKEYSDEELTIVTQGGNLH